MNKIKALTARDFTEPKLGMNELMFLSAGRVSKAKIYWITELN